MTGDINKFSNLALKAKGYVTYGDNNKGRILGKGKGKASSFRGPLDLSRLFTTKSQQVRYETYFFQKKIMKPKYGSFVYFPDDVFLRNWV